MTRQKDGQGTISMLRYESDLKDISCSSFDSHANTFFLIFQEWIIVVRMQMSKW